jgi:hypothetical protein
LHHAFQRAWRDVHAVTQHIALVWDVQALNYAATRLGLAIRRYESRRGH